MASLCVGLNLGGAVTKLGLPMSCACCRVCGPLACTTVPGAIPSRTVRTDSASRSWQIVPRVNAIDWAFTPVKSGPFLEKKPQIPFLAPRVTINKL